MSEHDAQAPVQGQLVMVRQRQYVVVDVVQGLPPVGPPVDRSAPASLALTTSAPSQHKVLLSSVEDDALGEELQVIWEIEPGARVIEKNALPEPSGFDDPARLDTFLHAVRWGAVSNAEVNALLAPFRSGIDLETYQLDPVTRAIQMPRVNLLIADDVGLGKTIEAGLVCQELIIRHRARTVLIVCPAALQLQWRDQMSTKFGLEFRIVDSDLMRELRRTRGIHTNPWTHFPRLITSIDFIKRERPLRLLRDILPGVNESPYPRRFDLLILDEAHNAAPANKRHYLADSQRTAVLRQLAPHFEHKLFLSATPHNGYEASFSALLELLDDQRFARDVEINRAQLERVMVRRLKADMHTWDDAPRFPRRLLEHLPVKYTRQERTIHQQLAEYTRLRLLHTRNERERFANVFVLTLLKKRLFSSPRAFQVTLARHRATLEGTHRPTPRGALFNLSTLRSRIEDMQEESDDDERLQEATGAALDEAALHLTPLSPEERTLLDELTSWAERASRPRADCKAQELLNWLRTLVKPGDCWSEQRVLIFTEYRDTQAWLQEILEANGLADRDRLQLLYGGMDTHTRERIKQAFQADPSLDPVRILLATDAASEGIDLQNYCSHLVHYEIPWNPNRLEQRNGRIDRHGQRAAEVHIYHFVGSHFQDRPLEGPVTVEQVGTLDGDLEFLWIALRKVEAIRRDLGKVGPVIAQQVEEAMLGKSNRLDTQEAEAVAREQEQHLKFEKDLRKRIEDLSLKLQESRRQLALTPANVQAVVETALELAGQQRLRPVTQRDLRGEHLVTAFEVPDLTGSWRDCTRGLPHPLTSRRRPVVFDQLAARGRDDVVLAHLNHRLVAMSLTLLRAATWSPEVGRHLHRVCARVVPDLHLDTPAVVAHARLVILGGDSQRLHEELIAAGGRLLEGGRFQALKDEDVQRLLREATTERVPHTWEENLTRSWPNLRERLERALQTLQQRRVRSLERKLDEHMQYESELITGVLSDLKRSIELTLYTPDVRQLSLFDAEEDQQYTLDRTKLQARAEAILGEIEAEQQNIQARYAHRQSWLFPVAVTFLVPARLIDW